MLPRLARQAALGAGVLPVGLGMAGGATSIASEAGYSGVGPSFLPWLIAVALMVCGAWLLFEAFSGGFRDADEPEGAKQGHWQGFAWVSAGRLVNDPLSTRIGFGLNGGVVF